MSKQPINPKGGYAAERLAKALATLTQQTRNGEGAVKPTIAALCRLAGVSRNSLYRYHSDILESFRKRQGRWRRDHQQNLGASERPQRTEAALLRKQIVKFTALIDHYYAAYRETSLLLARRDRELAELRRTLHARPTALPRGGALDASSNV